MAHVHTASFPSPGQHRRVGPGLFRARSQRPVRQRPPTSSCSRRTWAARSAASCVSGSLRTAERTSAAVARLAPTGGAGQRRDQVGDGRVELGRAGRRRWPARWRAPRRRRTARPVRQISMRPRVADQLDEGARAGQVGHQAERRLGQPELRVVGEDPQVAGQRELAAGADRVPLHGGDRDDARRAQPAEAGLVPADPLLRPPSAGSRPRSPRPPVDAGLGAEQAAVQAGGEGPARAADDDDAHVVVQRRTDRRPAPPRWPASAR